MRPCSPLRFSGRALGVEARTFGLLESGMGVDATLFVVADHSSDDWVYGDATINLCRHYDLWKKLEALPVCGHARRIQLMQASWNRDSEGRGGGGDNEHGYLFGDSYGPDRGFKLYNVDDLGSIVEDETNGKILDFVRQVYAGRKFLIIWH
mgnify:CR=1 FL=1